MRDQEPARAIAVPPAFALVAALLVGCSSSPGTSTSSPSGTTSSPPPLATNPGDVAGPVDIGGRNIYLDCRGQSGPGDPTVILISGYHDSSDVWNQADVLSLIPPAAAAPVQQALAGSHRVCSYDRPGTLRYIEGLPLTDRTTPVPQPRTTADIVAELHTLLATAAVPEPYLLVGHPLGGLMARLYAQTYPEQVAGVVFVDAFSPTVPQIFGAHWPIYRDQLLNPPADQQPLPSLRLPDSETVDLDASAAQVWSAPTLPPKPLAVLTKTESFGGLTDVPGLPATDTNRLYEQAEDNFVAMAPATPQIIATGSDHYIQFSQPDLVVSATELVFERAGNG